MSSRGRGRGGGGDRGGGGSFRGGGGDRGGGGSFRGGRGGGPPQVFSVPGGVPAPDKTVTKTEDALIAPAANSVDLSSLGLSDVLPRRPAYGTKGGEVTLWANYVSLTASSKLVLYRYEISITPAATGNKLTQVVRLLLEAPELAEYKHDLVSDFRAIILSRQKFSDRTINIAYRSIGEDEPKEDGLQYQVKLHLTNTLATSELIEYLTSTNPSAQYDEKLPLIQALNIFLKHYAKSADNLVSMGSANSGSSKTFAIGQLSDTWDLGNCLTAIRGFFASVRAATARVLVNINVSQAAFFQEGPLDQFILRLGTQGGLYKLQERIKGIRVRVTHLPDKLNRRGQPVSRVKTIWCLANKNDGQGLQNPPRVKAFGAGPKDVEFWLKDESKDKKKQGGKGAKSQGGQYISVYDFFAKKHRIHIQDTRLPVINVGDRKNPNYLPLQVCYMLPGQPSNTQLSTAQAQQMIRFAVRKPFDNATSIVTKGLKTAGLSSETNPLLVSSCCDSDMMKRNDWLTHSSQAQFGIGISQNLITVSGRVIASPKVGYGQNRQVSTFGGSWNMLPRDSPSLKFTNAGSMQKWSCVYIEMPNDYPHAQTFTSAGLAEVLRSFHAVLGDTGIAASPPLQPFQRLQLRDNDDPELEALMKRAASSLQLLFVILPATPIPLYNRVKYLGDVKYGIHTVCSVGTKIANPKGQDQYLRNLALKFNLKLGGNNHLVEPTHLGFITENKTMIVGIDVTHPTAGNKKAPSIASMVASIDQKLGQWPGILSIQPKSRQELVADLTEMLKSRLRLWRQKGKHSEFPENIIVYRDGVSEGQYQPVLDQELPLLRAACKEMYPAPDQKKGLPRMTVAIVGKRHHTRFYPTTAADADKGGNTKPGTVVDRGVTEARNWDFYLQAHAALQGTARPAHYYVVLDEIFRPRYTKAPGKNIADEFQDLTQSMCYAFGRATKAVSYCAPAYYADVLCERSRCYLSTLFESPSNSESPSMVEGAAGGLETGALQQEVQIHERLKDSMFYI
ncbi:Piwi domain-containing protein [Trichoderma pleuroticola]